MNAAETLLADGLGERTAIECGNESITYDDLRLAVRQSARVWQNLGLQLDDRVLVFAPDSIDWVSAYLGAIWAGGVAVGLNSRLFEKELGVILSESGARFIWCEANSVPLLQTLCAKLPPGMKPPQIVAFGRADEATPAELFWDALFAAAKPIEAVQRDAEDMALWIYTSGTTGIPKAVIHVQRVTQGSAAFAREVLGLTVEDRLYATSKLFFAYPLANSLFAGLRLGATVILDSEWPLAEGVVDVCERHKPTVFFSVPTLYHKILQGGLAPRLKEAGVRHCVSAGEALPKLISSQLRSQLNIEPVSGYGTSETLALVLYTDTADGIMQPTPLSEIRSVAANDDAEPRRLWVTHPSAAVGYWNRPIDQADCFADCFFSPGDMFLPRLGGTWEFTGRTDDMMKISGQWVSTLGVEQSLLSSCGDVVIEMGTVGTTSADGLSELALFVVSAPGRLEEARARVDAGIATLPGFKRPRRIHFVDELPRTATGKLQRRKLADMLKSV